MLNPLYKDVTFTTDHANLDAWRLMCDLLNYAERGTVYLVSMTPIDDNTFTVVINVDVDCLDDIKTWLKQQICVNGNLTRVAYLEEELEEA